MDDEDNPRQEQGRETLHPMSTWAQPQLKSDFLLLKHVKTEKPDDKALCWSPGLVIQASAQVLQILTKGAWDSD